MSGPDIWPFHCRAFLGDTEKLTAAETGAYIRLLIFYWHNRALPNDDDQLRQITSLSGPAWQRSRPKLQALFHDGWRHARADKDLAQAAEDLVQAASLSARQSAKAKRRWENNTGDKNVSRESSRGIHRTQRFQTLNNFPSHAAAMPKKERIESLPLELEGSTGAVEKCKPAGLPKKTNGQPNEARQRSAQQAWEGALRRQLGYQHHHQAIEVLAKDPALVKRATDAEIRDPGSGVMAAMLGLRGKLFTESHLGDDDL